MPDPFHQRENTTSSLYERLTPELRRAVDIAIVERVPPTFQGAWMQFKLAEHGITYSSFYRYARRLRDRANLAEITALADEELGDLDDPIRKLINRRLLEMLLHTDDNASIKELSPLLAAHCQAARLALHQSRQQDQSLIAGSRVEIDREQLASQVDTPRERLPQSDGQSPRPRRLQAEQSSRHSPDRKAPRNPDQTNLATRAKAAKELGSR